MKKPILPHDRGNILLLLKAMINSYEHAVKFLSTKPKRAKVAESFEHDAALLTAIVSIIEDPDEFDSYCVIFQGSIEEILQKGDTEHG